MRMSGLSKLVMSAFIGSRGTDVNGVAGGDPGDAEQVNGEGQLVLPARATRSYPSPHSAFRGVRGCVTEKLALALDSQVECGFAAERKALCEPLDSSFVFLP